MLWNSGYLELQPDGTFSDFNVDKGVVLNLTKITFKAEQATEELQESMRR